MADTNRKDLSQEVASVMQAFPTRGITATEVTAMVNSHRLFEHRLSSAPVQTMLYTMQASGKMSCGANATGDTVWYWNGEPAPEPMKFYIVCGVCGEAFDDISYAAAHESTLEHPDGCGDPDYNIRPESEAF